MFIQIPYIADDGFDRILFEYFTIEKNSNS